MLGPRKPLGGQYVGAGGALVTPEQVAQQKQIAAALLDQAGDTSPVGHWTAALNRGLQGWLGGRDMYRARQAESEGTSKALERFNARNSGAGAASRVAEALAGGAASSASQGGSVTPVKLDGSKEAFIQALLPTALEVAEQTGVDARIILAQAAQETGWGKSAPNNNFFGIKSHGESGGGTFATTEYVNGQPVTIRDSFRGYETPADSVRDYGNFLLSNPRYKPMLAASGDLDAQIAALGASGYATDPNYANAIRSIATGLDLSAFGGAGAGISQAPAASNVSEIATLLADPWLPKGARDVLQAEMNQQMQMQNAAYEYQLQQQDPMRQIQLQQERLKLDQMLNPGKPKPIEVGGVLLDAETFQPIFDSRETPKPTSDIQNYEYYKAEEAAAGRAPLSYNEWTLQNKKAGATSVNVGGQPATKFTDKLDETFAPEAMRWIMGGEAKVSEDMGRLDEALSVLEGGGNVTGAVGLLPTQAQAFFNPDGTVAKDNVQSVVQDSLKEVLGGSFTEKEGEAILARAFNPLLSPQENAKRVRRLIRQIGAAAKAKRAMTDYAMENGSLRGYTGITTEDIAFDRGSKEDIDLFSKANQPRDEIDNPPGSPQPKKVTSEAEYDALPSGTLFIDPKGTTRRKP